MAIKEAIKMDDKCTVRNCRSPGAMSYLGMEVCQRHWEEHCDGKIDLKGVR